jgi:Restriction endonuclease
MPYASFDNARMYEIGCIIADPSRAYYKPFPEFTPLEFEHFCAYLLYLQGYEITKLNSKIEPDGGIDFVAKKLDQWIIVQVKKSEWSNKSLKKTKSADYNIGTASVDRLLGTLEKKKDLYPNAIGYFFTLRQFSKVVIQDYCESQKIYLYNLETIRAMIQGINFERFGVNENKAVSVIAKSEIEYWGKADYDTIKSELNLVEKLIIDKTFEINCVKAKINEVEALIFENLRELYQEHDLLKTQLEYIKIQNLEKSKSEQEEVKKAFEEFQEKIKNEYEEVKKEFKEKKVIELSSGEQDELNTIWKKLRVFYHPDKHHGQPDCYKFEEISKLINHCNDIKDLTKLKDIQDNPHKYFGIDADEVDKYNLEFEAKIENLRQFLNSQKSKLYELENELEILLIDPNCSLYEKDKVELNEIIKSLKAKLTNEISVLKTNLENIG